MNPQSLKHFSKGRWLVERERCAIEAFSPPPPDPGGISLPEGVNEVLKKIGLADASQLAGITEEWSSIVGLQVAQHTRPGTLQNAELSVYVDSSVWLHELQRYGLKTMLGNLQKHFGATRVKKVRLHIDPDH